MPAPRRRRVNVVLVHAVVFILGNAALPLAWWWRGGGTYWPFPVHLIWAALLIMHWLGDWVQRTHGVE